MSINLKIPPEQERILRDQAVALGGTLESHLSEIIRLATVKSNSVARLQTPDEEIDPVWQGIFDIGFLDPTEIIPLSPGTITQVVDDNFGLNLNYLPECEDGE